MESPLSFFRKHWGTLNRWPSLPGRKAPINRSHSKRFAPAESTDHAPAFSSACVFSAALPSHVVVRWLDRFMECPHDYGAGALGP